MGAQYEVEFGHGGTVTLTETSVSYDGYLSMFVIKAISFRFRLSLDASS